MITIVAVFNIQTFIDKITENLSETGYAISFLQIFSTLFQCIITIFESYRTETETTEFWLLMDVIESYFKIHGVKTIAFTEKTKKKMYQILSIQLALSILVELLFVASVGQSRDLLLIYIFFIYFHIISRFCEMYHIMYILVFYNQLKVFKHFIDRIFNQFVNGVLLGRVLKPKIRVAKRLHTILFETSETMNSIFTLINFFSICRWFISFTGFFYWMLSCRKVSEPAICVFGFSVYFLPLMCNIYLLYYYCEKSMEQVSLDPLLYVITLMSVCSSNCPSELNFKVKTYESIKP